MVAAPVPHGLSASAWHYFALFVMVIAALVTEPVPGPAVGLVGVTIAAVLRLVAPTPAESIRWALTGFADTTVWLMGILTPYATGSAPLYYTSGYFGRAEFWKLGVLFGGVYLLALLGLGLPFLLLLRG